MKTIKLLSLTLIAALILSACQAGVTNETAAIQEPTSEVSSNEAVDETEETNEAAQSSTSEETDATEEETNARTEESSEEVAKFPVRDEKIPPYEIAMRDGSTVKLDQFEGQVVVLTFFTTW